MPKSANVEIINEAQQVNSKPNTWRLCLQWCLYAYDDGSSEHGYRFIWRRPDGSLQAARGQARIKDFEQIVELMNIAKSKGWGDEQGD